MAEFHTANGISFFIENIIKEAREELYLLVPYLQLSRELYEALKASSERDVPIIIVYANEDLHTEEKIKLGELVNLEIYRSENLNAKCCCNEENVLFTSMDMHQLSLNDNLEMGVVFNKSSDNELYKKVYGEIKSAITASQNMNLHKRPIEELVQSRIKVKKIYHGFCINCAMPISYNIVNPYCRSCAPENDEAKTGYKGNYCHVCGAPAATSPGSPLCDVCSTENT